MPIIHPDKPTRITITIGNIFFGALDGGRPVDWGLVFWNLAQKLVAKAGKTKPTSICLFLFHLYHNRNIFIEEEDTDYRVAQELISYRITPNLESGLHPGSEGEDEEIGNPKQPAKSLKEEQ